MEVEHKKMGNKTLFFFVLKRSKFLFAVIFIFLAILALSPIIPADVKHYAQMIDFWLSISIIVIAAGTFGLGYLEYHNLTVSIYVKTIKITKGVLTRHEIGVPFRRIKRIDIIRTLTCRFFGISNIVITTMGDEEQDADKDEITIPYIEKHLAEKIQHEILQHAQVEQIRITKYQNGNGGVNNSPFK